MARNSLPWPLLILLLTLPSSHAAEQAPETVGWRRDGSGIFPGAKPPLTWGREAQTIKALRTQPGQPKTGGAGQPLLQGTVREWLVLGPVPIPEDRRDLKNPVLDKEEAFTPAPGDKTAGLEWKLVATPTSALDLKGLFGADVLKPGADPHAAYISGMLFSPADASIAMAVMSHAKDLKIWLNGKPVKSGVYRTQLSLEKGWNRLLFRTVARPAKEEPYWHLRPLFFGAHGCAYDDANMLWTTRLPGSGVSGPIVVGGKVLFNAGMSNLVCLDKDSGRILWVRSNTYYDTLDAEARKPLAAELGPLAARLKELDAAWSKPEAPAATEQKEKSELEARLETLVVKSDAKRFKRPVIVEAGHSAMTCVSDGARVWSLFANGVVCCHALDGERLWIALRNSDAQEHGHTTSPLLVDGKLILFLDTLIALDAATGRELWNVPTRKPNDSRTYNGFHGTPSVLDLGGERVIATPNGIVFRAADGRELYNDFWKFGGGPQQYPSAVTEETTVFKVENMGRVIATQFPPRLAEPFKPEQRWDLPLKYESSYPVFYRGEYCASPLVHEGYMYCVNIDGLLSVVDLKTRKLAYQKVLDVDLLMTHNFQAGRGGLGSSPAMAGGKLYIFGNQGSALVLEPGPTFKVLARNRIEGVTSPGHYAEHQECAIANPWFDGARIYLRVEDRIHCMGEK